MDDAVSLLELPVGQSQHAEIARKLQAVTNAMDDSGGYYMYVCLNDILPVNCKKRFETMTLLHKEGMPYKTYLYTHRTGGSMGNFYFVWKVCQDYACDVQLTKAAGLTAKIRENIPVYHTCQMKQEFQQKFAAVANAKPVFLREMYKQLTHDASASENFTTADIDERARLLLDMQDPKVVVDLRDNNPGRPSKYEHFWQATCRK